MKQDNHGIVDSQDNHSKKVDKPDMGGYNDKEEEKALKEDEQSHFGKLVENINRLAMNIKPELCLDAIEIARFALTAEDQVTAKIMGRRCRVLTREP